MADSPLGERQIPDPPTDEPRLESWGEIAAYLRREIRTVQRWERYQGLPVRRLQIGKLGSVYAYRSELDKWYRERWGWGICSTRHRLYRVRQAGIQGRSVQQRVTPSPPAHNSSAHHHHAAGLARCRCGDPWCLLLPPRAFSRAFSEWEDSTGR